MKKIVLITWILGMALMTSSCRKEVLSDHQIEVDSAEEVHTEEIVFSPEDAKVAGVVSEPVVSGEFYGVIPVGGQILEAPGDSVTLTAQVPGIISFVQPITEGMRIEKESSVFVISSSHLQDGDPAQRARIVYEAALREYERGLELVKDKIISEKEFNSIRTDYENARLSYEAIGRYAAGGVEIKSPTEGYVKDCLIKEGDYVQLGQPLMSVIRNQRLQLRADLPERHYGAIEEISSARFKTSYSDEVYELGKMGGKLVAYGRSSVTQGGFIPVTFEFDHLPGIITGSFAEVYLLTEKRKNVITLPLTALTEEQGIYFIYLQVDESCYEKRSVELGQNDGERVEIIKGLEGGEQVVVQGAIHVRLASSSDIIPGHTHEH